MSRSLKGGEGGGDESLAIIKPTGRGQSERRITLRFALSLCAGKFGRQFNACDGAYFPKRIHFKPSWESLVSELLDRIHCDECRKKYEWAWISFVERVCMTKNILSTFRNLASTWGLRWRENSDDISKATTAMRRAFPNGFTSSLDGPTWFRRPYSSLVIVSVALGAIFTVHSNNNKQRRRGKIKIKL